MLIRRLLIAVALLAAFGCGNHSDIGQVTQGRKNLRQRQAACGAETAVNGTAGVRAVADSVYLEDWVVISVCHLDTLLAEAGKAQKPLTLFLEGRDTGVEPSGISYESGMLTFVLKRDDKNKSIWSELLYGPLADDTITIHPSVGVKEGRPLPAAPGAGTQLRLHKLYIDQTVIILALLLAGLAVALLLVGAKSDLLRDGPTIGGTKQRFSLARTQMAWWFFLILTGYVFIWLVTGDRDTIPASLLGLMGISAATALASVAISSSGTEQTAARRKVLDDELTAIAAANAEIDLQLADPSLGNIHPTLKLKKGELTTRRENIYAERAMLTTIAPSINWWRDLITDDNGGFGLDRVQILVWTLVLGIIFMNSVLWDLSMPEFNATLLALMGISSGTYIGFKLPAKKG